MSRRRFPPGLSTEPPAAWLGLLTTLAAVAVGTLLVYPLKSVAPVVSLGVVYLPAILLISIVWGLRLGLLASVASAVAGLARAQAVEAERRREQADRALAELERLAAERERMEEEMVEAEALRRSDELKTALLRSVSHDLRTPLTSVIAAGAALASPTLTGAERAEMSEAIVVEGKRLSRLVENLLDMSRLEAGKAEPHSERIDLVDVLDAARESIGAGREAVRLSAPPDMPPLVADAAQLERAFANLLDNAVRHGGGGPVTVGSRLVGNRIAVRVVDQGPGIPEAEWERIFEPFHHADGGAERGGAGLGLAIAKGFVEANGGEIAVESLPGQGTAFVVSFPNPEDGAPIGTRTWRRWTCPRCWLAPRSWR